MPRHELRRQAQRTDRHLFNDHSQNPPCRITSHALHLSLTHLAEQASSCGGCREKEAEQTGHHSPQDCRQSSQRRPLAELSVLQGGPISSWLKYTRLVANLKKAKKANTKRTKKRVLISEQIRLYVKIACGAAGCC